VNVTEPDILGLQATQRVKGILRASPDQWLTAAHLGAGYPEMPKEELVASRPLLKLLVELVELPGEGYTQTVLLAGHLSFPGIREDRDSGLTQINELRLGTKVYRVLPPGSTKYIQITLQLSTVISCDQNHRSVVGHFDQPVDPEVPFLNRGLVGGQVAVDHKEVNARLDGICDKPFQALGGIGEVVVFIEVKIASVGES
jgi:hypothetical protein